MKSSVSCRDLGLKCSFQTWSGSREQAMTEILEHTLEFHSDELVRMSGSEKEHLLARMDAKLK